MPLVELIELAGKALDAAGVAVILLGAAYSAARSFFPGNGSGYAVFRQNLGRSILLGLELLVAADIVRTVAVTPTLHNVLVLALIVLIRTFLSTALQVELDGRWPWQRDPSALSDRESPGDIAMGQRQTRCMLYRCYGIS